MDLAKIEEIVTLSTTEGPYKSSAIHELHVIRSRPDRLQIGINVFFETKSEMTKLFALSLLRDHLSEKSLLSDADLSQIGILRQTIYQWFQSNLGTATTPAYVYNNMISILTLCIKKEYPERWPTAFEDLILLGKNYGFHGADILIRVLNELEIEVVMFNEGRSKDEIAHNTLIKDTMRNTSSIKDIVNFLCEIIRATLSSTSLQEIDLGSRSLLCLSEMIGWVDVNLIISEAIPTIYSSIMQPKAELMTSGLTCLYELVKKGMDPVLKVGIVNNINLIPLIQSLSVELLKRKDDTVYNNVHKKFGLVIDMLVLELFGCWNKFEDHTFPTTKRERSNSSNDNSPKPPGTFMSGPQDILNIAPIVANLLHIIIPEMLNVLQMYPIDVAVTILPSGSKFIQVLKQQKIRQQFIQQYIVETKPSFPFLLASDYLDRLLVAILHQSQYPYDFDFSDVEDDEDNFEIFEGKMEIKKLFINSCRVYPERCIELLTVSLGSLPQPLSSAPFPPLEACLRLLLSFSESGQSNIEQDKNSPFAKLISAIQETDVRNHAHIQVQLIFFDISIRYLKLIKPNEIMNISQSIIMSIQKLGQCKYSPYNEQIRTKYANMFTKLCDALDGKAYELIPLIGHVLPEILSQNNDMLWNENNSNVSRIASKRSNWLSESAEVSLYEALSLMSTSTIIPPDSPNAPQIQEIQQLLFQQSLTFLLQHIQRVSELLLNNSSSSSSINNNNNNNGSNNLSFLESRLAQLIHCISSLLKNIPKTTRLLYMDTCDKLCEIIHYLLTTFQIHQIRIKCLNCLHHLLLIFATFRLQNHVPSSSSTIYFTNNSPQHVLLLPQYSEPQLQLITKIEYHFVQCLMNLLSFTEINDIELYIQLINQMIVELNYYALPMMKTLFAPIVSKYMNLFANYELSSNETNNFLSSEPDKILLIKQFLNWIYHLITYQNDLLLFIPLIPTSHDSMRYEDFFSNALCSILLQITKGYALYPLFDIITNAPMHHLFQRTSVNPTISSQPIKFNKMNTISLKRIAFNIINALINQWLYNALTPQSTIVCKIQIELFNQNNVLFGPEHQLQRNHQFMNYLLKHYLPLLIFMIGQPNHLDPQNVFMMRSNQMYDYDHIRLTLKDAANYSLLSEIAIIFWNLVRSSTTTLSLSPSERPDLNDYLNYELKNYLQSILQECSWSNNVIEQFLTLLFLGSPSSTSGGNPVNTLPNFKEQFKLFIRQTMI